MTVFPYQMNQAKISTNSITKDFFLQIWQGLDLTTYINTKCFVGSISCCGLQNAYLCWYCYCCFREQSNSRSQPSLPLFTLHPWMTLMEADPHAVLVRSSPCCAKSFVGSVLNLAIQRTNLI